MSSDINGSVNQNLIIKSNEIPKVIIWYYRLIGVTFGGLSYDRNKQFVSNKCLKYLGWLSTATYFIVGLALIHLRMLDPDYIALYVNRLRFTYYLSALILIIDIIQIVVNQLFLNINAIPMIENICDLGMGVKNRSIIYITFFVTLILRVIAMCYSLAVEKRTAITIFGLIMDIFFGKPAADSFLFISFTFSLSVAHYYRHLRMSIRTDMSSETIAKIRKSFVRIRCLVVRFDQSMILCQIVTIFNAMLGLMLEIYIMSHYKNIPSMALRSHYLKNSIGCAVRLILSCIINGMVYDEADQLLFALDCVNCDNQTINCNKTHELLIFRTLSRDLPNGFTIGGLLPLRRTTLLTIFSFIMTYAVILIQTGAQ